MNNDKRRIGPGVQKGGDYRPDIRNPLPGFYRARVEFNRDPMKLGRVKIRLPQLHGVLEDAKNAIPTSMLPWASPGSFIAAAHDMGQFIVPHVGTIVWIGFEEGDPNKPIYFGGIPSTGGKPKTMNHIGDIPEDNHPDFMGGHWYAGTEGDAPWEVYGGRSGTTDVTRGVIFKSPKGHTITYDDTDNGEAFTIIDRVGQVIKFVCPVPVNDNKGNSARRNRHSATNDDQSPKSPGSYIMIKSDDLKGERKAQTTVKIAANMFESVVKDTSGNQTIIKQTPTEILIDGPVVNIQPE